MNFDAKTAAGYAADKLDSLLERAHRDTLALVDSGDLPLVVRHFRDLREEFRNLKDKLDAIEKEVEHLSHEIIPNLFSARQVTSFRVEDVGNVVIANKWTASPVDKMKAMDWLRETGNGSLIIETINASTLTAFAKEQAMAGKPLPEDTFNVGTKPYTSIRK
jgi:hypothetical protein